MAQAKRFVMGNWVSWTSQANGSAIKKVGQIIEVVAAGREPRHSLGRRDHESYVVEVVHKQSRRPRKPTLYWPRASLLKPTKAPKA